MLRKSVITGLVIGLQLVSGYSYEADVNWLSKTWDRLEQKGDKVSKILIYKGLYSYHIYEKSRAFNS